MFAFLYLAIWWSVCYDRVYLIDDVLFDVYSSVDDNNNDIDIDIDGSRLKTESETSNRLNFNDNTIFSSDRFIINQTDDKMSIINSISSNNNNNLDDVVDNILTKINRATKDDGKDITPVPDITPEFVSSLVSSFNDFHASNGTLIDLSTVYRTAATCVRYNADGTLIVTLKLGLKDAIVEYEKYTVKMFGTIMNQGCLTVRIRNNEISSIMSIPDLTKCSVDLEKVTLDKLSNFELRLTGMNDFGNWMANKVANTVAEAAKQKIKSRVEAKLFELITDIIAKVNLCE